MRTYSTWYEMRFHRCITLSLLMSLFVCARCVGADDEIEFFEAKIRPVLVTHCYPCHSAAAVQQNKLKGALRLDSRAGIRRGGASGPAVVPGRVDKSLLISALKHETFNMPPSGRLPDHVLANFVVWIKRGAADPRAEDLAQAPGELKEGRHWAFQPLRAPTVPSVKNEDWPHGDLDRFLLARIEEAELAPAADAKKRTLVRRLSYDLIGLPPTPEDSTSFLTDDTPGAVATLVDRLLDSPHFGVHWARFWLDNVRYAEDDNTCAAFSTNTFDPRPYRDWVVRAWNDDLPYDEFVRYQIAGDLIESEGSERLPVDAITASGIWTFPHLLADNDPEKVLVDFVDQQVDVLSRTFLGITLACARCHDHKFDPLTQQDYYGLAGIFLSSHSLTHIDPATGSIRNQRSAYRVLLPQLTTRQQIDEHRQRIDELRISKQKLAQLERQHTSVFELRKIRHQIKQRQRQTDAGDELESDNRQLVALRKQEAAKLADVEKEYKWQQVEAVFAEHDALAERANQLASQVDGVPYRPAMLEGGAPGTRFGDKIGDVHLLVRGDHTQHGSLVPRRFPKALTWRDEPSIACRTCGSGRLELAQWITDPKHPLTSRVIVNRVWQKLFGQGLVRTPSNFGVLGDRPSHPELLDFLAQQFLESGWRLKSLIRTIVLSHAYQQDANGSARSRSRDPENRLLARMHRKRLTSEQLRDTLKWLGRELCRTSSSTMLATSGRALYLPVTRYQDVDPLLYAFDTPDPSLLVPSRSQSIAATQALFMLNSEFVRGLAKRWAEHLQSRHPEANERLAYAFSELYSRPPTRTELAAVHRLWKRLEQGWYAELKHQSHQAGDVAPGKLDECRARGWKDLCHVLMCGNEVLYVD